MITDDSEIGLKSGECVGSDFGFRCSDGTEQRGFAGVRESDQPYIRRQMKQVEQFKKMENKRIPKDINYDEVGSLRIEAVQKLKKFQPLSIGQASRISGVSPADISVLLVYMEQMHYRKEHEK